MKHYTVNYAVRELYSEQALKELD